MEFDSSIIAEKKSIFTVCYAFNSDIYMEISDQFIWMIGFLQFVKAIELGISFLQRMSFFLALSDIDILCQAENDLFEIHFARSWNYDRKHEKNVFCSVVCCVGVCLSSDSWRQVWRNRIINIKKRLEISLFCIYKFFREI